MGVTIHEHLLLLLLLLLLGGMLAALLGLHVDDLAASCAYNNGPCGGVAVYSSDQRLLVLACRTRGYMICERQWQKVNAVPCGAESHTQGMQGELSKL
jgi:hypothetical protein